MPVSQGLFQHCSSSTCTPAIQEATDIYKALLLDHRDLLALNVYVALCYAKLDYYDVSSEILQVSNRQHTWLQQPAAWAVPPALLAGQLPLQFKPSGK